MASLTQISISARKIIRYGFYLVILILILRFVFNISLNIYRKLFPPKAPEPTLAFGDRLPKLAFPEESAIENLNYTLELPEGKLPKLADQAIIYAMPTFQTDIETVDNAKKKASKLGFNEDGKVLIESIPNVYVFEKKGTPSKLRMNIITGIFSISYNINENQSIVQEPAGQPEQIVDQVRSYLRSAGILEDDILDGPGTYELLRYEGDEFVPAISVSEANATKVNIFRHGYGKESDIPAVTPDMPEANIWFIVSGRSRQIITGEYYYYPINTKKTATYPLKTSETAWEELKAGKAFIANLGDNPSKMITIRKVYLAYYDAGQYAEYYQPVIVFEGDNKFYAYVPGVPDEHYGEEKAASSN